MGILWFVLTNTLAATISVAVAKTWLGNAPALKRVLAILTGFPIVAVAAVISTGLAGELNILWVVSLLIVAALALASHPAVRKAFVRTDEPDRPPVTSNGSHTSSALDSLAIAFTVLMFCATCASSFLFGTVFDRNFPDDFTYHCPSVAQWFVHQHIVPPFHYHAYFPYNAEAFAAWFMLPVQSDVLVGLAGAYWLLLLWLSSLIIALDLGVSRAWGMIAASVITSAPMVAMMASRFSSPDLAGVAMTLAGIAFLVQRSPDTEGKPHPYAIYGGVLLGFAIGCKVSFAPALLAVLLWVIASPHSTPRLFTRVRLAGIIAASSVAMGSVWYLKNWIITGNPIFPAPFGPFGGPFSPADQAQTKLSAWILNRPTDLRQWWTIIHAVADWPTTLFALALLGYALTLYRETATRFALNRSPANRLLVLVGLTTFAAFFFLPFSATYDLPHGELKPALRYAILPFAIGIMLFAAYPTTTSKWVTIKVAAVVIAIVPTWNADPRLGWLTIPVAFGAMFSQSVPKIVAFFSRIPKLLTASMVILLAGVVLAIWYPYAKDATDHRIFFYDDPEHPIGLAWKALENTPRGSQIAWFTNRPQDYYPLFGRDFTRFPVALNPGGTPYRPLHELYKETGGTLRWWWWWPPVFPSDSTLVRNIARANVDYVLVSKWRGESWPAQQAILARSGGCSVFYQDGYSTIWHIGADR